MKPILLLLSIVISSATWAQKQQEQSRYQLPNWDSIDNALLGTEYVPFSITTLSGKKLDNHNTQGKVCFFSFWFKYCQPCIQEFDELNEIYSHFANDTNVVFVAITFDKKEEITDLLEQHKVVFPVATVASQKISRSMNFNRGYPSAVLLDKQGRVRRLGLLSVATTNSKYTITVDSAIRVINRYKNY